MSDQAQEGIFLLLIAVAIAVLWMRGYFTSWINAATSTITTPPVKKPFAFPSSPTSPLTFPGGGGR
jgi:hypothetical protein